MVNTKSYFNDGSNLNVRSTENLRRSQERNFVNNLTKQPYPHKSSLSRIVANQKDELSGRIGSKEKVNESMRNNFVRDDGAQQTETRTITEDEMKSEMVAAFEKVRLDSYSDILRIKKPSNNAMVAC